MIQTGDLFAATAALKTKADGQIQKSNGGSHEEF
jgi:hypothetical protein